MRPLFSPSAKDVSAWLTHYKQQVFEVVNANFNLVEVGLGSLHKSVWSYVSCYEPQGSEFRLWAVSELFWQKAQFFVYLS